MTLFERLRSGVSSEPATANPANPANSARPLAEISRNSSSSQPANQLRAGALTATHCRECDYPAPDIFRSMCPSCGTTHPFAATDAVSDALTLAAWAIAQAARTDEKKAERLADLRRKPQIAGFWAKLFDPTIPPTDSSSKGNP